MNLIKRFLKNIGITIVVATCILAWAFLGIFIAFGCSSDTINSPHWMKALTPVGGVAIYVILTVAAISTAQDGECEDDEEETE